MIKIPEINLHLGDCMDLMRGKPDGHYDLAVVDVPYGIKHSTIAGKQSGTKYGNAAAKKRTYKTKDWDDQSPSPEYFRELIRVSKNQIIWGANHFISKIPFDSSCWIIWDKVNGSNGFADCEIAWTSFDSAIRMFKYSWNGMIQGDMKNKQNRIQSIQSPRCKFISGIFIISFCFLIWHRVSVAPKFHGDFVF